MKILRERCLGVRALKVIAGIISICDNGIHIAQYGTYTEGGAFVARHLCLCFARWSRSAGNKWSSVCKTAASGFCIQGLSPVLHHDDIGLVNTALSLANAKSQRRIWVHVSVLMYGKGNDAMLTLQKDLVAPCQKDVMSSFSSLVYSKQRPSVSLCFLTYAFCISSNTTRMARFNTTIILILVLNLPYRSNIDLGSVSQMANPRAY